MMQCSNIQARNGDVIAGTYTLRAALGTGGMGVVYEAELGSGCTVAIKLARPDREPTDSARRLHAEAIAARYVSHENVVSVLDYSAPEDATPFVVMEHVRGISLRAILGRCGAMPLLRTCDLARQILSGLAAAHTAGVIHADIKSDNIMIVARRDGSETVKIIDFGLASVVRHDHAAPQPEYDAAGRLMMSGTPEYMAPEVIRGEGPLPASDLYAVGVIVYEMLTGVAPFTGSSLSVLDRQLHARVVRPSQRRPDRLIPLALECAVMTALEKNPLHRHASAEAFAAAIIAATPTVEPSSIDRARSEIASSGAVTEQRTQNQTACTNATRVRQNATVRTGPVAACA